MITGMPDEVCPFCDLPESDVIAADGACVAIWTGEPPVGSVMVLPRAHRAAPWDLSESEWMATQGLLRLMSERVSELHQPDGWNVGWNVGPVGGQSIAHAHCHLIPRYGDELHAGRGLRWWLKQSENATPGRG